MYIYSAVKPKAKKMANTTSNNDKWAGWSKKLGPYMQASPGRSWWQLVNSVGAYLALWVAMVYSLQVSYWLTLALAVPAAGFLVRIFIIFHDCGHGSFFASRKLNQTIGIICGLMVFTPYHRWHYEHQVHHQTVGNLDKRGMGDVLTMTVEEYRNSPKNKRFWYRMYRNPLILLLIVPLLLFTLVYRLPGGDRSLKMNIQTHATTLALVLIIAAVSLLIGFKTFLIIQLPVLLMASLAGVWLFYLQHQYKDVVWERSANWDYKKMAIKGSSFLKLPPVLQFFSGNIGYHHIHHLGPGIPNYYLQKCHSENPMFQKDPLPLREALGSIFYRLWDEENHRLVTFKQAGF